MEGLIALFVAANIVADTATFIPSRLHLRGTGRVVEEGGALYGWEGDGDADGGVVIAFVGDDDG